MKFVTLCSGIEAPSVAWKPLGWEAVAFSEIDPFACSVLNHHYPEVPNLGDMTKYADWNIPEFRLLHASTPCQSFSQMGDKAGVADPRGNLTLCFINIANHFDPDWITWENVPGVLNMADNAFGQLLGGLSGSPRLATDAVRGRRWPDAGVVSGPKRTIAWRIIDARSWLPQQRRRVFLIASKGPRNMRCAAALFPVTQGLRRVTTPSQQPQPDPFTGYSQVFRSIGREMIPSSGKLSLCLNAGKMGRIDLETETHIAEYQNGVPAKFRALTPLECERIQGFPDGYVRMPTTPPTKSDMEPDMLQWASQHLPRHSLSLIPDARSMAACPLGKQYSSIGNSMAVPVVRWIGERIALIDAQ